MTSWSMVSDKVIVVSADRILRVLNVSSRFLGCYNKKTMITVENDIVAGDVLL